ncbi:MAG: hypothetical protein L0Z50_25565, partial [Verrucomicrobiales bacterium]|nr:hypothetical protein [Verrucomicrobiales bacterium]
QALIVRRTSKVRHGGTGRIHKSAGAPAVACTVLVERSRCAAIELRTFADNGLVELHDFGLSLIEGLVYISR